MCLSYVSPIMILVADNRGGLHQPVHNVGGGDRRVN